MNVLFVVGVVLAPVLASILKNTRWGMIVRLAGESEEATAAGNEVFGAADSHYGDRHQGWHPGGGRRQLSVALLSGFVERTIVLGPGLMAVALVIFAGWDPIRCLWASLLFGGVGSLGLALQAQKLTSPSVAYLWFSAPYVLTLLIMILTCSRLRAMISTPAELSRVR